MASHHLLILLLLSPHQSTEEPCKQGSYKVIHKTTTNSNYRNFMKVAGTLGEVLNTLQIKEITQCSDFCNDTPGCEGFQVKGDTCAISRTYNLKSESTKPSIFVPSSKVGSPKGFAQGKECATQQELLDSIGPLLSTTTQNPSSESGTEDGTTEKAATSDAPSTSSTSSPHDTTDSTPERMETSVASDTSTSSTPATTQSTPPRIWQGIILGEGVNCSGDYCTCKNDGILRANFTKMFTTSIELKLIDYWWHGLGETSTNPILISKQSPISIECLPLIRSLEDPICPMPVIFNGQFSSRGVTCSGGIFTTASATDESECNDRNVAVCTSTGYMCGNHPFQLAMIYCSEVV